MDEKFLKIVIHSFYTTNVDFCNENRLVLAFL